MLIKIMLRGAFGLLLSSVVAVFSQVDFLMLTRANSMQEKFEHPLNSGVGQADQNP